MEPVTLATLADFKRFIATPGATVIGTYHWWADRMQENARKSFFGPRAIRTVQTSGYFAGPLMAWCDYGKKSDWRFENDTATRLLGNGEPCFTIRCEVREPLP